MPDIYVGRQPIYNNNLGIYGYELLFRTGESNAASFGHISADAATSATIINSFLNIGLEKLVGNRFAFINLTEMFLFDEDALPIAPDQVILEVLEDIPVTDQLLESIARLSKRGFIIALDDYIYNPAHKPLVAMADIIKIDIMQLSREGLIEHVNILGQYKAKLLAEKIETRDEYDFCKELGFDYFQGYFLSKPRIIKGKNLPTNKMAVLNLLAVCQNPDSDTKEFEGAISFDVSISYKILKLINSAFFSLPRKIESIRHAIVVLGRKQIGSLASMLALATMEQQSTEMIHLAMVRAKMCELLAQAASLKSLETYFTVGLLSALDILMERELPELIKPLPLSQEIVDALLKQQGILGEALACTLAYEVSDFSKAHFKNLEASDIVAANIEAIEWANTITEAL